MPSQPAKQELCNKGLGFRVHGLGFMTLGLKFRFRCLGLRVRGKLESLWFRAQGEVPAHADQQNSSRHFQTAFRRSGQLGSDFVPLHTRPCNIL